MHNAGWGLGRLICLQMALRAAIELNVFDIIAQAGPEVQLSSSEMVAKMPTTNPNEATALDRILGMLGANCILSMSMRPCFEGDNRERVYGLTSWSRSLLTTNEVGVSLAPILLFNSEKAVVDSFYLLKDAVLEQGCVPFNKAHGVNFFEYAAKEPRLNTLFNQAKGASSTIFFKEVLKMYKGFSDVKELMDVGGGTGTLLGTIVSKYPHIRGINFELPHVIADATNYPGVEHIAGDVFEHIPNAQTIMLKWILHLWDDDQCIKLLKNCCKALPNCGKVIVVEFVLPPVLGSNAESLNAVTPDLFTMALNPGGRERTTVEYIELAEAAGFTETKSLPISQGLHVMEFYKRIASLRPLIPHPMFIAPCPLPNGTR